MPRKVIALVAGVAVLLIAFLIYKLVGSPPIPLPVFHYTVGKESELYSFLKENDAITFTVNTDGQVVITEKSGQALASFSYTPKTLYNLTTLGERMILPKPQNWKEKVLLLLYRFYKIGFTATSGFLYHVIPVKITIIVNAE